MVFKEVSEGCAALHKADAGSTNVVLWLFRKNRVHRDGRTPPEITDYIRGLRNPEEIDTSICFCTRCGWSPMLSAVLSKETEISTSHSHARERAQSLISQEDQLKGLALAVWEAGLTDERSPLSAQAMFVIRQQHLLSTVQLGRSNKSPVPAPCFLHSVLFDVE